MGDVNSQVVVPEDRDRPEGRLALSLYICDDGTVTLDMNKVLFDFVAGREDRATSLKSSIGRMIDGHI